MFQFTIREMLWLTLVAALSIGWLIHSRSERTDDQFVQIQLMEQRLQEAKDLIVELQAAKEKGLVGASSQAPSLAEPTGSQGPVGVGRQVRVLHRRVNSRL
jgi:hypothetical protein